MSDFLSPLHPELFGVVGRAAAVEGEEVEAGDLALEHGLLAVPSVVEVGEGVLEDDPPLDALEGVVRGPDEAEADDPVGSGHRN